MLKIFRNHDDGGGGGKDLDAKLDRLLAAQMKGVAPAGLIARTMARLPKSRTAPIPWWSWAVYAAFFTTTVAGLAYWEWGALASVAGIVLYYIPKLVSLSVAYPTVVLAVVGAFFINALILWFVTADFILKRKFNGVMAR